jgi:hypothetical protein
MPAANHIAPPRLAEGLGSLGEDAWIEVIQKMDEVYNDLLQYEVALEEKNAALEESQRSCFRCWPPCPTSWWCATGRGASRW